MSAFALGIPPERVRDGVQGPGFFNKFPDDSGSHGPKTTSEDTSGWTKVGGYGTFRRILWADPFGSE